jgi:hypothetical protein
MAMCLPISSPSAALTVADSEACVGVFLDEGPSINARSAASSSCDASASRRHWHSTATSVRQASSRFDLSPDGSVA